MKGGKLTRAQLMEKVPGLIESRGAQRKAAVAAGLMDRRYQTRSGGSDKRHAIRAQFKD